MLLAAMVPFAEPPAADLSGTLVIISNGARDPMISAEVTQCSRVSSTSAAPKWSNCRIPVVIRSIPASCRGSAA